MNATRASGMTRASGHPVHLSGFLAGLPDQSGAPARKNRGGRTMLRAAWRAIPGRARHKCRTLAVPLVVVCCLGCVRRTANPCATRAGGGRVGHHTITLLADVVAHEFPPPLNTEETRTFAAAARAVIPDAHAVAADALQAEREAERKANMPAGFVDNAPRIRTQDMGELARMRGKLTTVYARADANAARAALAVAREWLDVDADADAELTRYSKALTETRVAVARTREIAALLRGTGARLDFTTPLEAFPPDAEGQAALALAAPPLRAKAKARPKAEHRAEARRHIEAQRHTRDGARRHSDDEALGRATVVRDFPTFDGIDAIDEVVTALTKPRRRVEPTGVSGAKKIRRLLAVGKDGGSAASLPARDMLCVGGSVPSKALIMAHLLSQHIVTIACEEEFIHGFMHGSELFVA
eukprot:gnl/Chilomastix_cuspidata/4849.p2 GENE.gnl/Chilomastix_cuspidata/4849~~gnl/Chilomastix_cuspidata/4849.p2  ORF type:complete len:414 (-),score=54.40 gnl/Chilomastix_cuspidata/4849:258-1499(-)